MAQASGGTTPGNTMDVAFPGDVEILITAPSTHPGTSSTRLGPPRNLEKPGTPPDSEDGAVVNTVTFADADDGATLVSIRTDAGSKEIRDMIGQSGMEGGVREQFEILEELAASLT